jgi:hypothetical protein
MICHHYKCVFIHIPKNAGQSIEHAFLDLMGLTWETRAPLLLRSNDKPELGPPRLSHLTARQYVECKYISPDLFEAYFKFAFVRNPWDRMVSMYKWHSYNRICTFKDFVFREFENDLWRTKRWFVCPQTDYLCDASGNLIVDFVGRYENLQSDFNHVCEQLGLPPILIPHLNSNRSGERHGVSTIRRELKKLASYPWWLLRGRAMSRARKSHAEYYDDESREYVAELYRSDIELFGYTFDGIASPRRSDATGQLGRAAVGDSLAS